jgi:hypothetical protein
MIRRRNTLAAILLVIGCLQSVVSAAGPETPRTAALPELKVEGGFDNAQTHGVRVEEATRRSPRVIIGGTLDVEGMPEKARDVNRFIHWHFRLTGCKGRTVRFELYYARANPWPMKTIVPVVRYADGGVELIHKVEVKSFGKARGRFMEKVGVTWSHRFRDEPATLSYSMPFTNDDVAQLVKELRPLKSVTVNTLGKTPLFDLPLYQIVVTDPSVPDEGKRGVWLYSGEDPWEFPGTAALAGFVRFVAGNDPLAREFRKRFVLSAIPLVNPDAVRRGDTNFYMDPKGRDIINTGLSWKRTDIVAHEMIKTAMKQWKADGRAVDLMTTMHSSCFWTAVLRIDWAYDKAVAQRFIDEVYAKKYIPWAAGKGMGTPADMSGTLGSAVASRLWPQRLLFFGQHLEQIIIPKWELLGTPKAKWPDDLPTDYLRCQRPDLATQGELFARAVAEFYKVTVPREQVPPFLMCGDVDTYWGSAGEERIYTVLYRDTEGRAPKFVRLHVGEQTVEMQKEAGEGPVKGLLFKAAVPLAEGNNAFWLETSNGSLHRRYPKTGSFLGPYVRP